MFKCVGGGGGGWGRANFEERKGKERRRLDRLRGVVKEQREEGEKERERERGRQRDRVLSLLGKL